MPLCQWLLTKGDRKGQPCNRNCSAEVGFCGTHKPKDKETKQIKLNKGKEPAPDPEYEPATQLNEEDFDVFELGGAVNEDIEDVASDLPTRQAVNDILEDNEDNEDERTAEPSDIPEEFETHGLGGLPPTKEENFRDKSYAFHQMSDLMELKSLINENKEHLFLEPGFIEDDSVTNREKITMVRDRLGGCRPNDGYIMLSALMAILTAAAEDIGGKNNINLTGFSARVAKDENIKQSLKRLSHKHQKILDDTDPSYILVGELAAVGYCTYIDNQPKTIKPAPLD